MKRRWNDGMKPSERGGGARRNATQIGRRNGVGDAESLSLAVAGLGRLAAFAAGAVAGHALNTPDDSTFSRRAPERTVWIRRRMCSKPRHVVIDATGLKVYDEGE